MPPLHAKISASRTKLPQRLEFQALRRGSRLNVGAAAALAVCLAAGFGSVSRAATADGAASTSAAAPTPVDEATRATAKAKLVEGGDLLKRGEYTDALARFKDAYQLIPSPKIHYNLGLAFMGLGRKAEAMEAFESFLNDALDAAPDLRANAERHRSTLAQQTGALSIVCEAPGAEITVDGRPYGITPRTSPIRLDPGPHQLVVELAGTPPFTQRLTVAPGQRVSVNAGLSAKAPANATAAGGPRPTETTTPTGTSAVAGSATDSQAGHLPVEAETKDPTRLRKIAAWSAAGAATSLLGWGIVERLSANSKYKSFDQTTGTFGKCDADPRVRDHGGGACPSLLSAGDHAARLATVGFVASAALAATAGGLFWWAARGSAAESDHHAFAGCAPGEPVGSGRTASRVALSLDCAFRF